MSLLSFLGPHISVPIVLLICALAFVWQGLMEPRLALNSLYIYRWSLSSTSALQSAEIIGVCNHTQFNEALVLALYKPGKNSTNWVTSLGPSLIFNFQEICMTILEVSLAIRLHSMFPGKNRCLRKDKLHKSKRRHITFLINKSQIFNKISRWIVFIWNPNWLVWSVAF